jgi:hypothetical protein
MKSILRKFWPAVLAICCIVPGALAQTTTVDVTSAGTFGYDGIYMSPYSATVGGAAKTTVICDDFADNSYLNVSWTGNITQFSNLASSLGSTLWGSWFSSTAGGSVSASTIIKWYQEAAWLTLGLLSQPNGSMNQAYYSFATWAVFDPNSVLSWLKSYNDTATCMAVFGNACTSTTASKGSLLYNAQQNYMNGNYSNFLIITPMVNGKICTPGISGAGNCPAQEFFEVVSEGGTAAMYLLLAGLACFAAVFMRHSRSNVLREMA